MSAFLSSRAASNSTAPPRIVNAPAAVALAISLFCACVVGSVPLPQPG